VPHATVAAAFQSRLETNWAEAAHIVVGVNGITEPPRDLNVLSFLVVQYPISDDAKFALERHYIEEGVARLVLNIRSGLDPAVFLPWADELASLFRERKFGTSGDQVETFRPSGTIVNDANDDGNWFEIAVLVPYRYQFADA
jgi:hypothetical protein